MQAKKLLRVVVATALSVTATAVATPAASAQQQCAPAGGDLRAVPWEQRLLAPERVWPMTTGAGQRIAVISTGVGENPLLRGKVAEQVDLAPAPQGQQQPSGRPDCLGIGTGVAGVLTAGGTGGVGFHGVAPNARILAAKVVGDRFPDGLVPALAVTPDTLASAVNWAVDRGATVIAVPTIAYSGSDALLAAVRRALAANIVVVAATGEIGTNDPATAVPYPASYDGVIGVGSIGQDGLATQVSRPQGVDLVAPGDTLMTTYPDGGLGPAAGSAFAAGYVAGVAALVRAYRPELSNEDVARRLRTTATPAPEGTGSARYGYGVVNPYAAVLDTVTAGDPRDLPAITPSTVSAEEKSRQEAENRADNLATTLAAGGIALAALLAGIVAFGPRGRRRNWRSGLAPMPEDRPESERPEPPVELFADRSGN